MLAFILAFLAGVWVLQSAAALSSAQWFVACALPLLLKRSPLRLLGVFAAGFIWALLCAHLMLLGKLPAQLHGEVAHITAVVDAMPQQLGQRVRLQLRVENLHSRQRDWPFRGRVQVDDYAGQIRARAGERWRLAVRLRVPVNYANPGGFDLERWYFERRIAARGTVITTPSNVRLEKAVAYPVQQLRQEIADKLRAIRSPDQPRAMMLALVLGDKSELSPASRALFRRSGTAHLMAISGLHIGMFAALSVWLMRYVFSRFLPATVLRPALLAFTALAAATAYAALAGWAIPTRRALVMLAVYTACRMCGVRAAWPALLASTVFVLVLLDPMAVLSEGLWLSLYAVALIACLSLRRAATRHWLWVALRVHLCLCFAMVPILILVFGEFSTVAPIANFVCVPVVGLLLLPLLLLSTTLVWVAPEPAAMGFELCARIAELVLRLVELLAGLPFASLTVASAHPAIVICASVATALALAPPRLGLKPLLLLWAVPVVMLRPPVPATGEFQVELLDVGQGLSALVRTRHHQLLFDTGPRFPSGFSTAEAVVLPYLRRQGVASLDLLILSHSDNDHAGGANALHRALDVRARLSGGDLPRGDGQPCRRGQQWSWDGVSFEILHPGSDAKGSENDRSCVLMVSNERASILFAADIEAAGESALLRERAGRLGAQVLVAPHHGSASSSSRAFVEAVAPRYVLVPAGFDNRYGFPHAQVIRRYERIGAKLLISGRDGMLSYHSWERDIGPGYRHRARRYWHRD